VACGVFYDIRGVIDLVVQCIFCGVWVVWGVGVLVYGTVVLYCMLFGVVGIVAVDWFDVLVSVLAMFVVF